MSGGENRLSLALAGPNCPTDGLQKPKHEREGPIVPLVSETAARAITSCDTEGETVCMKHWRSNNTVC